jgi:rhamnosyltransferase
MSERICGVIVTLFPDVTHLHSLVKNLQNQVEQVIIVDNSGGGCLAMEFKGLSFVEVLINEENLGVAVAHNQGIQWAGERSFSHVFLLDQDSLTETGMVDTLLSAEKQLLFLGMQVAAVGPVVLDSKSRVAEPLIKVEGLRVKRQQCSQLLVDYCEVAYLISSGCLIRLEILSEIGLMDEGLFIDLVDVEWGLRCRRKGFVQYVCCTVQLSHTIGAKEDIASGYTITKHSPLRLYYQYRNFLLIARRYKCRPFGWFFYQLMRRLLPRIFLFPLLVSPRLQNIVMICRGVRDGFAGVDGKYNTTGKTLR